MRYILFAVLSVLIFIFVYLVTVKRDKVPGRLRQIEKAYPDSMFRDADSPKDEKKGKELSFLHIPQSVRTAVTESGLLLRVEEYVIIWISLAVLPAQLYFIFSGNFFGAIPIVAIGTVSPPLFLKMKKNSRLKNFGVQLGDALMLVANGLRAGFSFEQVLETVAKDMPDPISSEFARVSRELKMGMSLEESLTTLTERMDNTDMRLLTSAVLIQRQVGGNLAEILDNISVTIQDRIKIKNHISSLTAQGRISGIIVGLIPVFLYIAISAANPEYMSVFSNTVYGRILLTVAVIMETAGFLIIRKMSNLLG